MGDPGKANVTSVMASAHIVMFSDRLSWALLLVTEHLPMNARQQWTKPRSMLNLGFPGALFLEELEVRIELN